MIVRFLLFLLINSAALFIGSLLIGSAVLSDWYYTLHKAPWTPPGWVFGAAWSFIMLTFSVYMAYLWKAVLHHKKLVLLYMLQWVLNVGWNPVFFRFHWPLAALVIITMLTFLVTYFLWRFRSDLNAKSWFIVPYVIWMFIATSLNVYIVFMN